MRNDYTDYLIHSKGLWKKHKYIKKVGSRYYYKTDFTDNPDTDDSRTDYSVSTPFSNKNLVNVHEKHYVDLKDTTRRTSDYERTSNIRAEYLEKGKGYQINRKTTQYVDARTGKRVSKLSVNMHASVNSLKKKTKQIQNGISAALKLFGIGKKTQPELKEYRSMQPRKLSAPVKEYKSIPTPRKLTLTSQEKKQNRMRRLAPSIREKNYRSARLPKTKSSTKRKFNVTFSSKRSF